MPMNEGGPPRPSSEDESTRTAFSAQPGTFAIGSFRIVRKLGEGGMGIVYEAEQQNPRRAVALKVIRGGAFVDDMRVKMFQREAQTLAHLKHPAIAALYELGRTDDGQHFFAMELVRGETLGEWMKKRNAGPSATGDASQAFSERRVRLGLFRRICDAVAYAHQRGVIHRDLKPANILVLKETSSTSSTREIGVPEIRILDFGLARITDADVAMSTVVSELGSVRGTLPYMSPEQVRGNPDEIDLRTDVYSLGVILYELMAGRLPYDVGRAGLPEAVRVICEESPHPLTKTWSGSKRLDADVATIALKALEKEPSRRYQTVAALGEDVQRYLADQPIHARPPSTAYQLRKLVVRHKVVFGFMASLFVVLVAFAAMMTVQAHRIAQERDRATVERDRANHEAATSQQVSDFLVDLFHVADPSEARGNTITAREVLDKGADKIEQGMKDQPAIEGRLMGAMGQVYHGLGLYDRAESLLRKGLALDEKASGPNSLQMANALDALEKFLEDQGRFDEARDVAGRAVAIKERLLRPDDVKLALSLYRQGDSLVQGRPGRGAEGAALIERAQKIFETSLGPDSVEVAWCWHDLGLERARAGDFTHAADRLRHALAIWERVLPRNHPDLGIGLNDLAYVLMRLGAFDEARSLLERALAIEKETHGEGHPLYGNTLQSLGELWWRAGDPAKALPYLQHAVAIREKGLAPGSPELAIDYMTLGAVLRNLRRFKEAEPYLREALDLAESGDNRTPITAADAAQEYATLLHDTGRDAEARAVTARAKAPTR